MPLQWQQIQSLAKSGSPTFLPQPNPQGDVMSEKCKQPLYELTVQKHCTTYKGGMELHCTYRWTIQLPDAPGGRPFRLGA